MVAKCIYCDRARPNDYPHVYTEMWFLNVKYLIFTPRQLEKIIIILKSSILLVKQMVPHKSIRMDLVTLQDLLFLPKRLMWKNITRLFLKFGSGSEMSHIIMLQLFFLLPLCMFTSDRHILPPTYQCNSVQKKSSCTIKEWKCKEFCPQTRLVSETSTADVNKHMASNREGHCN